MTRISQCVIVNALVIASQGFCTIFQVIFIIEWRGQILTMMFWIGPVLVKCKWFLQCLRLTRTFSLNSCIKHLQWHTCINFDSCVLILETWIVNILCHTMLQSAFCRLNKSLTIVTFWVGFVLMQKPPAFFIILTSRKYCYRWQDALPSIKRSFNMQLYPSVVKVYLNSLSFDRMSQITSEEVIVLGNADNLFLQQTDR